MSRLLSPSTHTHVGTLKSGTASCDGIPNTSSKIQTPLSQSPFTTPLRLHFQRWSIFVLLLGVAIIGVLLRYYPAASSASAFRRVSPLSTWVTGDVFVAISAGTYAVYDHSGALKDSVFLPTGGETTGCAFDVQANLYTTAWENSIVFKVDGADPHDVLQTMDPTLHGGSHPESIAFARNGDFYVGVTFGNADIQKYNAAGVWQQNYDVAGEGAGSDWIDLSSDQHTMFYTSEGRHIKRYDLATNQQLSDFATLPGTGTAFAFRLLPPGDGTGGLLVADGDDILRLNGSGQVVQTYDVSGANFWFGLNIDPVNNGASFWTGDSESRSLYRFNIATGAVEVNVPGITTLIMAGICVKGEVTAGQPTATPTPIATPTTTPVPTITCVAGSAWCTQLGVNVGTGSNELRGIVATSNDDVWAVGGYDITVQGGQPLVERWNGTMWSTSSPVPTIGILNGVAALASNDVWAVSDNGVIHWKGTSWATSPAPNGAKAVAVYATVSPAAYDVWAVGATNVEHYDGVSWSISTPVPSGGVLNGVAAIDHNNVWAVGNMGTNPLAMHYTGSWTTVAIPTPTAASVVTLNSVDAYSSDSVWVVGSYYANDYYHTLVEYWDGATWRIVPSPNPSQEGNYLYKVYVTFPGDVWAVGAYDNSPLKAPQDSVTLGQKTLILHWNGQSWDQIDSISPGVGSQLLAITGATSLSSAGKIISSNWAVGSYINSGLSPSQTLIEHITPPTAPVRTRSYYEQTTNKAIHHQQGCAAANQDPSNNPNGLVILDYGQPKDWPAPTSHDWGTFLITDLCHPLPVSARKARITDIMAAVESFMDGYVECELTGLTQLHIAVSINNDNMANVSGSPALNAGHAAAWAQMVSNLQDYAKGYPEIFVSAGIDAEPNFDPGNFGTGLSDTEIWMQAYSDASVSPVFNFGSLDGYPCRPSGYPGFPPPRPCRGDSWDQDRDYNVTWGIEAARPAPEIYNSGWARDWYIVKRWGMERYPDKAPMQFKGVMSECNAGFPICQSNFPDGGRGLEYRQAWSILWLELNSDPVTGLYPDWATYIDLSAQQ